MVEAILQAAARVFARGGYPRATTNRIAEEAGISVGSLYQYFPSKDAIAVELLRRYRETLVSLVHRHLTDVDGTSAPRPAWSTPGTATLEGVVRAVVTAVLRAEGIEPALHRVLIERVVRTPARAEVGGFEEKIEEILAAAIRSAQGQLQDRSPEVTAFVLVRAVLGVVHSAVVDRPAINGPELEDELTRLVVRFLEPGRVG